MLICITSLIIKLEKEKESYLRRSKNILWIPKSKGRIMKEHKPRSDLSTICSVSSCDKNNIIYDATILSIYFRKCWNAKLSLSS